MQKQIRIGSRGSKLALWQAEHVKKLLQKETPETSLRIQVITTKADAHPETPVMELGAKSVFVKELENALLAGDIDLAVHSLKDMTADLSPEFHLPAYLGGFRREDALVSRAGQPFFDLPAGSKIASSSPRRVLQMKQMRPDLQYVDIRGNIDTRLRKLDEKEFDGLVLAAAGLERLGLLDRMTESFAPEHMIPAGGQGILAIETSTDSSEINTLLKRLNDSEAARVARIEFAFLKAIQATCHTPVGIHVQPHAGHPSAWLYYASPDGKHAIREYLPQIPEDSEDASSFLREQCEAAWLQATGEALPYG